MIGLYAHRRMNLRKKIEDVKSWELYPTLHCIPLLVISTVINPPRRWRFSALWGPNQGPHEIYCTHWINMVPRGWGRPWICTQLSREAWVFWAGNVENFQSDTTLHHNTKLNNITNNNLSGTILARVLLVITVAWLREPQLVNLACMHGRIAGDEKQIYYCIWRNRI